RDLHPERQRALLGARRHARGGARPPDRADAHRRVRIPATVIVRSRERLRAVVDGAPAGFGSRPGDHRYDVLFLQEPLRVSRVLPTVPALAGVDEVRAGPGVLYYTRLVARASESQLGRLPASPFSGSITVRNWNTTVELARRLEQP